MLITKTPLRISIAGGGTDFPDFYKKDSGVVVSMAITKYIYVLVSKRYDPKIILSYSNREEVSRVEDIHHDLMREAMKKTGISESVEVHTLADVRSTGSGLGSSSSLTVGLLNALYQYQGIQVQTKQLAQEACEIEIDICKKPIGVQDQYIAAYGGLHRFDFLDTKEVALWDSRLSEQQTQYFGERLLLFHTGIGRKSEDILKEQKENLQDSMAILRKLKEFAIEAWRAILTQNFDIIGDIFKKSWEFKKTLATAITNPEIDAMYDKALNAGAIGGKICGAGGGGHLVLYALPEKHAAIRKALKDFREVHFGLAHGGSMVIFNNES